MMYAFPATGPGSRAQGTTKCLLADYRLPDKSRGADFGATYRLWSQWIRFEEGGGLGGTGMNDGTYPLTATGSPWWALS